MNLCLLDSHLRYLRQRHEQTKHTRATKEQEGREPTSSRRLLRPIRHIVPKIRCRTRIILKRMQQPISMPDFMRSRAPLVIPVTISTWHRIAEHVAPVQDVHAGRRGGRDGARGQRAISQKG